MVRLGGTFLSSHDPESLASWFESRFDIEMQRNDDGAMLVMPDDDGYAVLGIQKAREGVAAPDQPVEAEPYGRQPMMLNLRVKDVKGIIERLQQHGDAVEGPKDYGEFGHFAWTRTPDGHDLELWQP